MIGVACRWSSAAAASRRRWACSACAGRRRSPSDEDATSSTRWPSLAALAADRARHASSAAERSEWFERMAHTDPLTGLANERTVARVLELELARAGRQGGEVSLALFDVDDFRAANASDGRRPATTSCGASRPSWPSRSGWSTRSAGSAATSSCSSLRARPAPWSPSASRTGSPRSRPWPAEAVSVSAGVATLPARTRGDAESLIAAANAALMRAKRRGQAAVAEATAPRPERRARLARLVPSRSPSRPRPGRSTAPSRPGPARA